MTPFPSRMELLSAAVHVGFPGFCSLTILTGMPSRNCRRGSGAVGVRTIRVTTEVRAASRFVSFTPVRPPRSCDPSASLGSRHLRRRPLQSENVIDVHFVERAP